MSETTEETAGRRARGLPGVKCCYVDEAAPLHQTGECASGPRELGVPTRGQAVFAIFHPPFGPEDCTYACGTHLEEMLSDAHEHRIFWAADNAGR